MVTTYDAKCYELAEAFAADYEFDPARPREHFVKLLALAIQQAIEDEFTEWEHAHAVRPKN